MTASELKKSILQMAVEGKLTKQSKKDEPVEKLLKRIKEEKESLIKEGKIKKEKTISEIYKKDGSYYERIAEGKNILKEVCIDEELPFEIPENWSIVRLNDIGEYRKGPFGSSLTKDMFVPKSDKTIKVYEQKNAIKKDYTLGDYYITKDYYEQKMKSFTVQSGDILVSCAGTIGETYVLPENIEVGIINQALMRMRIFADINIDYFLIYFDYILKDVANKNSKGSAIKNIPTFDLFKKLILPLPPIEEQGRIVHKINKLNNIINTIKL